MTMPDSGNYADSLSLSKRAARRLIQRAFVLAGRDRNVRQHIRQANVTTLWTIEDRRLAWTIVLERGRVEFERRPTKKPDVSFTWSGAEEFFSHIESGAHGEGAPEVAGDLALQRLTEPVYRAFRSSLRELLRNPVDEDGDPLL